MNEKELIEDLSALEHSQWSHWTKYMLEVSEGYAACDWDSAVERWKRQIDTPYADLSEKEKDSDREWARKVLGVLRRRGILSENMRPIEDGDAMVSCPTCGAGAGQQCSDPTGKEWASWVHVSRGFTSGERGKYAERYAEAERKGGPKVTIHHFGEFPEVLDPGTVAAAQKMAEIPWTVHEKIDAEEGLKYSSLDAIEKLDVKPEMTVLPEGNKDIDLSKIKLPKIEVGVAKANVRSIMELDIYKNSPNDIEAGCLAAVRGEFDKEEGKRASTILAQVISDKKAELEAAGLLKPPDPALEREFVEKVSEVLVETYKKPCSECGQRNSCSYREVRGDKPCSLFNPWKEQHEFEAYRERSTMPCSACAVEGFCKYEESRDGTPCRYFDPGPGGE